MVSLDFDRLADRHRDAVYAQMVRLCRSYDDAEDALAEALMEAYRALSSLRDPEAFRGWLAKIARRACYRLKHRPAMAEIDALIDGKPGLQAEIEAQQTKSCLLAAVEALPPKLRAAYLLCDVDGCRDTEAAGKLGLSLPALKSRLHRARRAMRESLESSICADESFSEVAASG